MVWKLATRPMQATTARTLLLAELPYAATKPRKSGSFDAATAAVKSRTTPYFAPAIRRHEFLHRHAEVVGVLQLGVCNFLADHFAAHLKTFFEEFLVHHQNRTRIALVCV